MTVSPFFSYLPNPKAAVRGLAFASLIGLICSPVSAQTPTPRVGNIPFPGAAPQGLTSSSLAVAVQDLNSGLTAQDLAQALVGPGIAVTNATFTGDLSAGGLFSNGVADGLGIESGVILSSGAISNAVGPNDSDNTTTSFGTPGDSDLDALIPQSTNDAAVLEFTITSPEPQLTLRYVFASEEYNEFANSNFNDVFAFLVDEEDIALVPNTTIPVSINNVNAGNPVGTNPNNPQFFVNNDPSDLGTPTPFETEFDGFTVVLSTVAATVPVNQPVTVKIAIADAGDTAFDSAVFLEENSFQAVPIATPRLVKRVSEVNGSPRTGFVDAPDDQDDNAPDWPGGPTSFILGTISENLSSTDRFEQALYLLADGQAGGSVVNTEVCELIPAGFTVNPDGLANNGVAAEIGGSPASVTSTLLSSGDPLPASCDGLGNNVNQAIIVDVGQLTAGTAAVVTIPFEVD